MTGNQTKITRYAKKEENKTHNEETQWNETDTEMIPRIEFVDTDI